MMTNADSYDADDDDADDDGTDGVMMMRLMMLMIRLCCAASHRCGISKTKYEIRFGYCLRYSSEIQPPQRYFQIRGSRYNFMYDLRMSELNVL